MSYKRNPTHPIKEMPAYVDNLRMETRRGNIEKFKIKG